MTTVELIDACARGDAERVETLLSRGTRIDFDACLPAACAIGSVETVRALVDFGADPDAPVQLGRRVVFPGDMIGRACDPDEAILFARETDSRGVLFGDVPESDARAIIASAQELLEVLLSRDARTAVFTMHTASICALLAIGIRVCDSTPVYARALSALSALVREHTSSSQSKRGRTPLHTAFETDDVALACELLSSGADITAQDHDGWTPLHLACSLGNMNVISAYCKFFRGF